MKIQSMISSCALLIIASSASIAAMTEQEYNAGLDEINNRYQATYDAAETEGKDIEEESGTCLFEAGFDADWEVSKVSFDVPEVTFKNREFSFHTVKTTFKNKVIAKTKIPKTYFEVKDIGFGIKTKIPVVRMELKEFKTKVPEFTWDRTSFKTKIPEFNSKRIEWKFHLLKLKKLEELNVPCKNEEERAQNLSVSVESAAKQHETELQRHTATYLATQADKLATDIVTAESEFDRGIASMDQAIADVRKNGIDPAGVTIQFDNVNTTMTGAKQMLVQQKLSALAKLRASHQQIIDTISAMRA